MATRLLTAVWRPPTLETLRGSRDGWTGWRTPSWSRRRWRRTRRTPRLASGPAPPPRRAPAARPPGMAVYGRCGWRANRPGQDLAERGSQSGPGLAAVGRMAPGDEPVRADQDRAAAVDLAVAQPGAARVVQVAVEVADAQRVERDAGLRGELPGRLAPGLAVPAGDQQEPARRHEVLDRAAVAVLVLDPGVRQGSARTGGRFIYADLVGRHGSGAAVGNHGGGVVAVAIFGRETVDSASGPACAVLRWCGRRAGGLGPGLTSDSADAARVVLRDDLPAGSQVSGTPPALPVWSAWPGSEAGVHRSGGQRVRAIPHQRKGRH